MKMIFATANLGKLREAAGILGEGFELVTSPQAGITEDIPETGTTLKENSDIKATYIHDALGCDCFADDSGLEVDALDGAPGVYTARFAGPDCRFEDNIDKLLSVLEGVPEEKRTARFRTVVTLIWKEKRYFFEGVMEGKIAFSRRGTGGFGYDPVFIPSLYPDRTLAELGVEVKNAISHRGQALRAMAVFLKSVK